MAPLTPPPVKKYLCLAPRPEEWEERAQAILRSNVTKDHIQSTLKKLYQMHPNLLLLFGGSVGGAASSSIPSSYAASTQSLSSKSPQPPALPLRTGPGRKSNAEYAVQFYEFLLQMFKEQDSKKSSQSNVIVLDDDDEKEQEEVTVLDAPEESEKNDTGSAHGDEDTEEIHDHHIVSSDVCAVCTEDPGTAPLICSKCRLIFHRSCVRPKVLEHPPPSEVEWLCSYCVLASTKRNTKQRKQAAAAVRYMARLRKFHQRNPTSAADVEDTTLLGKESDTVDALIQKDTEKETVDLDVSSKADDSTNRVDEPDHAFSAQVGGVAERKERSAMDEAPLEISTTSADKDDVKEVVASDSRKRPSMDVTTSPQRSSKRCRKQPTLYDPQDVPASRWQTDELTEWKLARAEASDSESDSDDDDDENEDDEDDGSRNELDKSRHAMNVGARKLLREKSDGIWCNFCQDDPEVPLCVFCACRVCFDPPLESVPDRKQWYCPVCAKAKSRKHANSTTRSSRRSNSADPKNQDTNVRASPCAVDVITGKRRSLRSPKPSLSVMILTTPSKSDAIKKEKKYLEAKTKSTNNIIKRPRGRPPKHESSASLSTTRSPIRSSSNLSISDNASSDSSSSNTNQIPGISNTVKRKVGRPPIKQQRSLSEPPRKRGRPPSESTLAKRAKLEALSRKVTRAEAKGLSPAPMYSSGTITSAAPKKTDVTVIPVTTSTTPIADSLQEAVNVPVTVSRSGRTVRRSNFHDEVAEGAQHLKSVRSTGNLNSDASPRSSHGALDVASSELSQAPDKATPVSTGVYGPQLQNTQYARSTPTMLGLKKCPQGPPFESSTEDIGTSHEAEAPLLLPNEGQAVSVLSNIQSSVTENKLIDAAVTSDVALSATSVAVSSSDAYATALLSGETQSQHAQMKEDALKQPRRKPGARECMQISRRFGVKEIPQHYMDTLLDYCNRGKVEHLIRMRERLDEHSRFLEMQLAGLESLVLEHGESDIVVPLAPPSPDRRHE